MSLRSYDFVPEGFDLVQILGPDPAEYEISTMPGVLYGRFRKQTRMYTIFDLKVDVPFRRLGIGKQLLSIAGEHAQYVGAGAITAVIQSRECLDAMTSVFGFECVRVLAPGDYAPKGHDQNELYPTNAGLWYDLR